VCLNGPCRSDPCQRIITGQKYNWQGPRTHEHMNHHMKFRTEKSAETLSCVYLRTANDLGCLHHYIRVILLKHQEKRVIPGSLSYTEPTHCQILRLRDQSREIENQYSNDAIPPHLPFPYAIPNFATLH
jgi:hypothetical protein